MMLIQSWPKSLEAWQRSQNSLAGGVSTGLRASMKPLPLSFGAGAGSHLRDVDGNDYIDYVLGWGPVILGHGHPGLTDAVARQLPLGATYGAGHALEYVVAEKVLDRIPGTERVLWSNTGSEATQVALRLARAHTGRRRFIKFAGNYHGWSDAMLVGYRPDATGLLGLGSRGQNPRSLDDAVLLEWGNLGEVEEALRGGDGDIAAVFVEPVLINSGAIPPPAGFLTGLRELCDRTGTVLVFDEVITGFRIGSGGAVTRFGVTPDLIVLAKAIAGGYPLAAVAGRAQVIDEVLAGVVHAGTYNGNPVVLAAANATLDALAAPGIYDDFERRGGMLAAGIRGAFEQHGLEGVVNQVGPVVQVLPGVTTGGSFGDFLESDHALYDKLSVEMLRRGLFTLPGGRWYISTAHTDAEIAETVAVVRDSLDALADSPVSAFA